jgi:endonuclease/exonuclease/phosphatase family metal-dependent hydrolase
MLNTRGMNSATERRCGRAVAVALLFVAAACFGGTFRIATYNLESYLDTPTASRPEKSEESKAKVRESILAIRPDVLALQEVGSVSALLELRDSLKPEGLDLPYWQLVMGSDTNIHVALLSRFGFSATRPHTNENFLLNGRRFRVSRGFAEVDIEVDQHYSFTLIAAHLKSKRAMAQADEAELRLEEAKLLRERIDERLAHDPDANLVVLGDFNDTQDAPSTREVMGRGKTRLIDTRPAERNGDDLPVAGRSREQRCVTWTHYYSKEDTYSRIDFVLLSKGMAREWVAAGTYVLSIPNWGLASDHRPVVATFMSTDK